MADKIPPAMFDARKIMKQPSKTWVERRTSIRPASINNPSDAIARTAKIEPKFPRSAP
jgi:hypothetical protein